MRLFDIKLIARYIALSLMSKQMSVSPLKLQKLLYYTQAWNMVFFGRDRQVFQDIPQAWVNGPVYPVIYEMWRDRNMCEHLTPSDFGVDENNVASAFEDTTKALGLNYEEMELLEQVVLKYGSKSQNHLIFLTHSELPWCEKREGLKPYERSTNLLSLDTMYNYYRERHSQNLQRRQQKV